LRGLATTVVTVRDGLRVGLRPWLGEFTAADWPCGTRGQGPDGPSDVDRFVDRVAG